MSFENLSENLSGTISLTQKRIESNKKTYNKILSLLTDQNENISPNMHEALVDLACTLDDEIAFDREHLQRLFNLSNGKEL